MRMAERINLVPGSEDGVRAAAAVVFSRPHGREDCEEEQAHRPRADACAKSAQETQQETALSAAVGVGIQFVKVRASENLHSSEGG